MKIHTKTINLKYQLQRRIINLNCLTDCILYQDCFESDNTDNPLIETHVNKIENRIPFKIKKGYYFKLLIPEMMKLLGSTKGKLTKDENG